MQKALKFISAKLPYLVVGSIVAGMIHGYFFESKNLQPLVTPVMFLMIYPMMINVQIDKLFRGTGDLRSVLVSLFLNFVVSPAIAYTLATMFLKESPMLATGLFLIALIPTSGMTASWTGLARGDLNTALVVISTNLLAAIFLLPVLLQVMTSQIASLDINTVLRSLAIVVVAPLIAGDLTRRGILKVWGKATYQKIKPHFGSISSLGVLLIVFIAVSLKSRAIFAQAELVLISMVPLVAYYLAMFALGNWGARRILPAEKAIAVVYGSTMRNLTIALGITLAAFGNTEAGGMAVFLIALAYMVQVPAAAFYMRFVQRHANSKASP